MSEELIRYVQSKRVLEMIEQKQKVYVAYPTRCDCGAVTRKLGEPKVGGSYICPLCGCALPYSFWDLKCEKEQRTPELSELIISVHEDACVTCGEYARGRDENDKCRCARIREAEDNEVIRQWYVKPMHERDVDALPLHMRARFEGWRKSIEEAKERHAFEERGDKGRDDLPKPSLD
jgi:hypothetical protein